MLVYPSSIDLSIRTLRFLAGQLTARRGDIGTRWRRLPVARQALLALAHLLCGDTYARLAAGLGIGIATVYRYLREAIEVLAALAPTLAEAMRTIRTKAFVILDGTLLPIDRIAADTPYYSGKHKRHGMNVQVPSRAGASCGNSAAAPPHHRDRPGRSLSFTTRQREVGKGSLMVSASPAVRAADAPVTRFLRNGASNLLGVPSFHPSRIN